MTMKKSKS